jgi:hypothetical protein
VQHPRADFHTPDFGIRVLGKEALRGSEGVAGDDIHPSVDVNGHDLPAVGRLDLRTEISLVDGITALGGFRGGIA